MRRAMMFVALVLLCGTAVAQRTWTVDSRGGADFGDIPPALAAAAPGEVILVRYGTGRAYTGPDPIDKPVSIIGDPAQPPRLDRVRIERIPAGSTCVVANFGTDGRTRARFVEVTDCQGSVVLLDLRHDTGGGWFTTIDRAGSVVLSGCDLWGYYGLHNSITDSNVSLSDCVVHDNTDGRSPTGGGLVFSRSVVDVTDCEIHGGNVTNNSCLYRTLYATPALAAYDSSVHVRGDSWLVAGEGYGPCAVSARQAIQSNNPVVVDPRVFLHRPSSWWYVAVEELVSVHPSEAVRGSAQNIEVRGPTGSAVVLLVSRPSGGSPIQLLFGDLWLHPSEMMAVGSAPLPTSRRVSFDVRLPATLPDGLTLLYQAAALDRYGVGHLGNADVSVPRRP